MASLLATHNLSLYTIPAGWVLCMAPHAYAMSLAGKTFDPRTPRSLPDILKGNQTLDAATKATILRAEGAQSNGFENLGLFAAAVVAGNMALLPTSTLNYFSLGYLATRVVYNFIYVNNRTRGMAGARTMIFFGGVGCILGLLIKSGNVLVGRGAVL